MIPEKEFQDEYQRLWARKSELQQLIDGLKKHNLFMSYIVVVAIIFGGAGLVILGVVANNLHKFIELFN